MPKPLSADLRKRIVEAYLAGKGTYEAIAAHFFIGVATVSRLLRLDRTQGSVEPKPHGGGQPRRITGKNEKLLGRLVDKEPDATAEELTNTYNKRVEVPVSVSTIKRALKRLKLTRKKKTFRAEEGMTPEAELRREAYLAEVRTVDPNRLIFIDESGSNAAMTREYARAAMGERAYDKKPFNRGENISMIGALSVKGIEAFMTIPGSVDGDVFRIFTQSFLCPVLQKEDVVVFDNLSVHKVYGVTEAIEACGARVLELPPYGCDLNPIEECWSKIKSILRKMKARSIGALNKAIAHAIDSILPSDAKGWFQHCGYII